MREEVQWLYILALKFDEPLGFWIAPSNMKIGWKNFTIDTSKVYRFIVDNKIDFDPNGGRVR